MEYMQSLQQNLSLFGKNLKGASEIEINQAEEKMGFRFPEAVREFLLFAGNDYSYLWRGTGGDGLPNQDYQLKLSAKLLAECKVVLPADYYPFSTYSGDQFMFFYFSDGDNPPVYRFEMELFDRGDEYIPGSVALGYPKGVSKIADTFSELINYFVQAEIKQEH